MGKVMGDGERRRERMGDGGEVIAWEREGGSLAPRPAVHVCNRKGR